MPYVIRTDVFEGPLHLLLDLIEKRKLLINDIALGTVADDFLAHVKEMEELPLDETAEFVALAATLLLMKSRSLLPFLTLTEEEQEDVASLEKRLAILKAVREASKGLEKSFGNTYLMAPGVRREEPVFAPDKDTTLEKLRAGIAYAILMFPQPIKELPKAAVKKIISLEETIVHLTERISREMKLSFREFSGIGKAQKTDVIVSFLALLELVKQGILLASQDAEFGDITLETDSVSTPSYG